MSAQITPEALAEARELAEKYAWPLHERRSITMEPVFFATIETYSLACLIAHIRAAATAAERERVLEAHNVAPSIVGRYRVEKRSSGFWPYSVKAGNGTMELFIGHKTQCEEVAQALQTACLDGAFMVADEIRRGG